MQVVYREDYTLIPSEFDSKDHVFIKYSRIQKKKNLFTELYEQHINRSVYIFIYI